MGTTSHASKHRITRRGGSLVDLVMLSILCSSARALSPLSSRGTSADLFVHTRRLGYILAYKVYFILILIFMARDVLARAMEQFFKAILHHEGVIGWGYV